MKRNYFVLVALATLGLFASCKQKDVDPNGPDNEPKNIREVTALLASGGHVPNVDKTKNAVTSKTTDSTYFGKYQIESTGFEEPCSKVTKRMHYDYVDDSDEFSVLDPWASILWPGCLVQGRTLRGDNVPSSIPVSRKRKPGTIILQIVSGADAKNLPGEENQGMWYEEVDKMSESRVIQAQNNLIRRWRHSGVPASTSYSIKTVHSMEETAIAAGLDLRFLGKLKASLNTNFKKEKSYALVKLTQRFYTMTYEDPFGAKDVFTDDIRSSDLAPYTGPGNPICYVSSVSYGRIYYLLFESSVSSSRLAGELEASFGPLKVNGKVNITKIASECSVKMVQRGGDAKAGLAAAIDPSKIQTFIEEGAIPSDKNVGAPISFTVKHLYDNELVKMASTKSYSYDKIEFAPLKKTNNVAIFLRDVTVNVSTHEKRHISADAKVKIVEASVEYGSLSGYGSQRTYHFFPQGVPYPESGVRSTAYLNINKAVNRDCGREPGKIYNNILLRVKLQIRPEVKTSGFLGTGFLKKTEGRSEKTVELVQQFTYNETEQAWSVRDVTGGSAVPFRSLSASRRFENATFHIAVNYSFLIDNSLRE